MSRWPRLNERTERFTSPTFKPSTVSACAPDNGFFAGMSQSLRRRLHVGRIEIFLARQRPVDADLMALHRNGGNPGVQRGARLAVGDDLGGDLCRQRVPDGSGFHGKFFV